MQTYHNAPPANNTGLLTFSGLPLFDWHEAANTNILRAPFPAGLTSGGRIVYARTRRPVSTCNALAALAGIGQEASYG